MHELTTAESDSNVGRAVRDRLEKHQIAGLNVVLVDVAACQLLLPDLARKRQPRLRLDEARTPANR